MEKVITDNLVETIKVTSDEGRVLITRKLAVAETPSSILLNQPEAEELHKFLGEWLK